MVSSFGLLTFGIFKSKKIEDFGICDLEFVIWNFIFNQDYRNLKIDRFLLSIKTCSTKICQG